METRIMALIILLFLLWLILSPTGRQWVARFVAALKNSGGGPYNGQ